MNPIDRPIPISTTGHRIVGLGTLPMAPRPVIGAGLLPRLLPVIISALLLLLLRPAHAGWGGVSDRNDPRLAVKEPGTTRQVAPGQQFSVAITVKKARHRVPALFEVVLPDGALFVGPTGRADERASKTKGFKGRTPAPTSEFGRKAKRAAAKRFPLPDAIINGTAGERTLQWHLDTFKPRHNPIKLTFEADFCGCPSPLKIRLLWQQGGRSARPATITVSWSWGVGWRAWDAYTHEGGCSLSHTHGSPPPLYHIVPHRSTYRPRSTLRPRPRPSSTGPRSCRPTSPCSSSPATAPTRPTRASASSASTTPPGRSTTGDAVRTWSRDDRHVCTD